MKDNTTPIPDASTRTSVKRPSVRWTSNRHFKLSFRQLYHISSPTQWQQ